MASRFSSLYSDNRSHQLNRHHRGDSSQAYLWVCLGGSFQGRLTEETHSTVNMEGTTRRLGADRSEVGRGGCSQAQTQSLSPSRFPPFCPRSSGWTALCHPSCHSRLKPWLKLILLPLSPSLGYFVTLSQKQPIHL